MPVRQSSDSSLIMSDVKSCNDRSVDVAAVGWRVAVIFTGIPIILWASQAVLMKALLHNDFGSWMIIFMRSTGALLLAFVLARGRVKMPRKPISYLPGLFLAINFVVFNQALYFIDAYLLMVIETLSLLMGVAIDRVLRVPVTIPPASVGLALAGTAVLFWDAGFAEASPAMLGLALGLATALTFAFFNCTLRFVEHDSDSLISLMLPIAILSLPFAVGEALTNPPPVLQVLAAFAVVGVLQTGVTYLLWAKAGRIFSGTVLCQLTLLTIPLTFGIEAAFLNISIDVLQIVASLLVVLSIFITTRRPQVILTKNPSDF